MSMAGKGNIHEKIVEGHRYCKKLINDDYGTIAFLINKNDILRDKKANANSFSDIELKYNCIYFLIGYEQDEYENTIEKMYVGQAGIRNNGESVLDRLNEHAFLGNDPARYLDKWTDIVVVTNEKGAWGATELDALEHIFWSLIPVGNRYNSQKPTCTGADLKKYTDAVNQIKEYLDYLCYNMFKNKTPDKIAEDVKKVADAKSDLPIDLDQGTTKIPNITTPRWIVEKMVGMLPQYLFDNPDITFFDPACKGGEYLEVVLNRCMSSKVHRSHFENKGRPEIAQAMHIINKQLYGIALTPNSFKIAYNRLYESHNIRLIPNYAEKIKRCDMLKLLNEEFGRDMSFDVIIGNPPYQDASGRASIYKDFVEKSVDIADMISMITRDNWLNGKAFKSMRDKLTEEGAITDIEHYPKVGEVFPGIKVSAAYFLWKKGVAQKTKYKCIKDGRDIIKQELDLANGIIYKSEIAKNILTKIGNRSNWAQVFNTRSYPFMDQRKRERLTEYCVYRQDDEHTVGVMINGEPPIYVNINNFNNSDEVYKYKVMCGVIVNEASIENPGNVLTNIKAIGKGIVASETWSLVASFNTEEETVNCKKYIMTKFVRFVANQSVNGRSNVTDNTFECVPLQDFTASSDIDWTQTISDIDKQLYKKYNLSDEEILYIEKMIKPISNEVPKQKVTLNRQEIEAAIVNKLIQSN